MDLISAAGAQGVNGGAAGSEVGGDVKLDGLLELLLQGVQGGSADRQVFRIQTIEQEVGFVAPFAQVGAALGLVGGHHRVEQRVLLVGELAAIQVADGDGNGQAPVPKAP